MLLMKMSNIGSNLSLQPSSPFSIDGKEPFVKNSGQWLQKGTVEYDQIYFYLKSCLIHGAHTTMEVDFGLDLDYLESSGDGFELDSVEVNYRFNKYYICSMVVCTAGRHNVVYFSCR